jgi:hypothetical protein
VDSRSAKASLIAFCEGMGTPCLLNTTLGLVLGLNVGAGVEFEVLLIVLDFDFDIKLSVV